MTTPKVIVSFRGQKVDFPPSTSLTVADVRRRISEASATTGDAQFLDPTEVKLILKGKVLGNNDGNLQTIVANTTKAKKPPSTIRIVAMGVSHAESQKMEQDFQDGIQKSSQLVRDDISDQGKQRTRERQSLGRQMMKKANTRQQPSSAASFGFGRIETLPNLPEESKARAILTELANDLGIKACMAKHRWNVGSLAELYPEGKVGESAVCVMGLNRNKGQQILLRLRTDDLKGFRKILSIREVLYHELAHNVHSEHNGDFFQLMRKIKKECLEMDWTQGSGLSNEATGVTGGTHVLGGEASPAGLSARELAGRAAMLRLTAEEEEIRDSCGCGHEDTFLQKMREENKKCRNDA